MDGYFKVWVLFLVLNLGQKTKNLQMVEESDSVTWKWRRLRNHMIKRTSPYEEALVYVCWCLCWQFWRWNQDLCFALSEGEWGHVKRLSPPTWYKVPGPKGSISSPTGPSWTASISCLPAGVLFGKGSHKAWTEMTLFPKGSQQLLRGKDLPDLRFIHRARCWPLPVALRISLHGF